MNIEQLNQIVNPKYTDDKKIEELNSLFVNAPFCKHIVLDNFFTEETADLL